MLSKAELLIFSLSQHGRIKVRTTAEQAEAKRKEREKKLKFYKETTSRIYEKVFPVTSAHGKPVPFQGFYSHCATITTNAT